MRTDSAGAFWETAFDVVSLAVSIVDVCSNPDDAMAWVGLVGDAIDLIPFVAGVGETVRAVNIGRKTADLADDVYDASRIIDNTGDIINTAGDAARKIDFYITPNGEAIPATLKGFDDNLSKLELKNNKYYGNDSRGPVRIRVEKHDPTPGYKGPDNPYHCNPHFHIDRKEKGSSGSFRKVFTGLMEWLRI